MAAAIKKPVARIVTKITKTGIDLCFLGLVPAPGTGLACGTGLAVTGVGTAAATGLGAGAAVTGWGSRTAWAENGGSFLALCPKCKKPFFAGFLSSFLSSWPTSCIILSSSESSFVGAGPAACTWTGILSTTSAAEAGIGVGGAAGAAETEAGFIFRCFSYWIIEFIVAFLL